MTIDAAQGIMATLTFNYKCRGPPRVLVDDSDSRQKFIDSRSLMTLPRDVLDV